jgi:hypothetical protein
MSHRIAADLLRRVVIALALVAVSAGFAAPLLVAAAGDPTCGMTCCEATGECCCDAPPSGSLPARTPSFDESDLGRVCPPGCAQVAGRVAGHDDAVPEVDPTALYEHAPPSPLPAAAVVLPTRRARTTSPRAPPFSLS